MTSSSIDLDASLNCGQAFRWRREGAEWVGVVGHRVVRLVYDGDGLTCRPAVAWPDVAAYLRLDVDLAALQAELAERDPAVAQAIGAFPGLRLLRQPALETLLTFVCTPATNVTRITRSIDLLARLYGDPLDEGYHAFPSIDRLARTDPGELMQRTGLGFRGKNLRAVAAALLDRPRRWAESLAGTAYEEARLEIMRLPGIGPKIADCICLFGLGFDQAVPVDTHVWQIGRELFGGQFGSRTLTPATYDLVRAAWVDRYGPRAGWAQQYLFHFRRVSRVLPMPAEVRLTDA